MKRIGFIGAQSMQIVRFGEALASGVPGFCSSSGRIWAPDAPNLLGLRMAQGEFSGSFDKFGELLLNCDAAVIALLDGVSCREVAVSCLERDVAIYVCNPFARTPGDAEVIIEAAAGSGIPMLGGSPLCFLPEVSEVAALTQVADEITISFAAEWDSPYGGWYHEGSHLTDLCAAIAGCDANNVSAALYGKAVAAKVEYPKLNVKLLSLPEQKDLRFSMRLKDGEVKNWIIADYEHSYRLALERFSRIIRGGERQSREELMFSAQLLDSIVKSLPE